VNQIVVIAAWTWSFIYGLFHTLQPCEDKAIFGFHTFGIAKNNSEAIKIVFIYSLGLFTVNNVIGLGFSTLGSLFSWMLPVIQEYEHFLAPVVSIIIGFVLYYRLAKFRKGDNHVATPVALKIKKNLFGTFLLGILTGIPPCPFELAVYIQAFGASGGYLINGVIHVFWFSVGTIVGMIFLTMVVTSFKRLDLFKEKSKDILQKTSLWILIGFGFGSFVLALFGISLFPAPLPIP
jgi:ABC-type nickel/cobalt efflux system permease component RcnA